MRAVKIKWLDAHGDGGAWRENKEIKPDAKPVVTYGRVVKESKKYICVIQNDGLDKQHYNHMCIPHGMIVSITKIK